MRLWPGGMDGNLTQVRFPSMPPGGKSFCQEVHDGMGIRIL